MSDPMASISSFAPIEAATTDEEDERAAAADVEAVAEKMTERVVTQYLRERHRLPDRRQGYTQKAVVGGRPQEVYLRTGDRWRAWSSSH
jgi:hypothetical protein